MEGHSFGDAEWVLGQISVMAEAFMEQIKHPKRDRKGVNRN